MTEATRPDYITCAHCAAKKPLGQRGPIPTYCSANCRAAAKHQRARQDGRYKQGLAASRQRTSERRLAEARPCPYCGDPMTHPRRIQCGKTDCKRAFQRDRVRKWQEAYQATAGQWYAMANHAEAQRAYGRLRYRQIPHWRIRYPERGPIIDARRRMRVELADKAEAFTSAEVHERDSWTCGLCRLPVDPGLAWPHPLSASVDHILPLSQGGSHTLANVQCAHLSCNSRKCDRVEVDLIVDHR